MTEEIKVVGIGGSLAPPTRRCATQVCAPERASARLFSSWVNLDGTDSATTGASVTRRML